MARTKHPGRSENESETEEEVSLGSEESEEIMPVTKKRKGGGITIRERAAAALKAKGAQSKGAQTVNVERGGKLPVRRATAKEKGKAPVSKKGSREALNVVKDLHVRPPRYPRGHVYKDYKKDSDALIEERRKNQYLIREKEATDDRFLTWFQQDYYQSFFIDKTRTNRLAKHQWIDWTYMERLEDPDFDKIIIACQELGIKDLLGLKCDWNEEVVCQFYATLFVEGGPNERIHWMTQGVPYSATYAEFAECIGIGPNDKRKKCIYTERELQKSELEFMYFAKEKDLYGTTTGLENYYFTLNRILRVTLAPKAGYSESIVENTRNLLARFAGECEEFCVMDWITGYMFDASLDTKKVLPFAPYIMALIEKVTNLEFEKDQTHSPLKPRPQSGKQRRIPGASGSRRQQVATRHGRGASSSSAAPLEQDPKPSSALVSFLKGIFNICQSNSVEIYENKRRIKKLTRRIKSEQRAQGREVSPDGSEVVPDDGPPQHENPFEAYEAAMAQQGTVGGDDDDEESEYESDE